MALRTAHTTQCQRTTRNTGIKICKPRYNPKHGKARYNLTGSPQGLGRRDGTIRVGSSRVLLDLVVHHFKQGATAEQIQHSFPSVTLRDIYGAIFYYLEHTEEVETYLANQETQAEEIERTLRSTQGPTCVQKRLEERRARIFK